MGSHAPMRSYTKIFLPQDQPSTLETAVDRCEARLQCKHAVNCAHDWQPPAPARKPVRHLATCGTLVFRAPREHGPRSRLHYGSHPAASQTTTNSEFPLRYQPRVDYQQGSRQCVLPSVQYALEFFQSRRDIRLRFHQHAARRVPIEIPRLVTTRSILWVAANPLRDIRNGRTLFQPSAVPQLNCSLLMPYFFSSLPKARRSFLAIRAAALMLPRATCRIRAR